MSKAIDAQQAFNESQIIRDALTEDMLTALFEFFKSAPKALTNGFVTSFAVSDYEGADLHVLLEHRIHFRSKMYGIGLRVGVSSHREGGDYNVIISGDWDQTGVELRRDFATWYVIRGCTLKHHDFTEGELPVS